MGNSIAFTSWQSKDMNKNDQTRYVVRHVSWSPERDLVVESMKQEIPNLEVYTDVFHDWYRAFFDVCDMIDETGAVLLENDVLPCKDFRNRVEAIIQEKGKDKVISFFEKPKTWLSTAYVGGSNFSWMQCLYLPPGVPGKAQRYFDEFRTTRPKQFKGVSVDIFLRYVFVKEKIKYWRIRPCMVQHLNLRSLAGHSSNRNTIFFVDDLEARGIDYNSLKVGHGLEGVGNVQNQR